MNSNRPVTGALILIGLGLLLLLDGFGMIPSGLWGRLIGLWPVLLITAGVDMLLRRSGAGAASRALGSLLILALLGAALAWAWLAAASEATGDTAEPGQVTVLSEATSDLQSLSVDIGTDVAALRVRAASPGTDVAVVEAEGRRAREVQASLETEGDDGRLSVRLSAGGRGLIGTGDNTRVIVTLPRGLPLTVELNSGVGRADVDLGDMTAQSLKVSSGVGELNVDLPAASPIRVDVKGGVGTVNLRLPETSGARVWSDTGVGMLDVSDRFRRTPDSDHDYVAESDGPMAEIHVDVGVGRITIR